jgi:hypothetical protein
MIIWQYSPWFGSASSSSEQSGSAWSSSALHTQSYDNLTYLSAKFKEKTTSYV